ncbi:hypothetical protein F5882DRAFT_131870 [Hyaloscypha sp. PMI_1271]|nr:hypothetical protein F5882DRAFT_131870 [Hyaloscypha sp. PMI_1271]
MTFIEKFNVDRDSDVVLTPIPGPRAEHFDEIKLKTELRSLQTKINALDAAVTERKEKEKLERAKKDNEERQRIEDEKRRKKELRRSLSARYRGFIKERAEYFGEAAFSEAELSRIIEYKRKLREELEMVIIRKGGEIENASGCFTQETRGANKIGNRHPEPPKLTSMAEPKCPDEIELDQLLGLKSAKWRELEKVRDREDRLLAQERHRAQEANQKAQRSLTGRKSIKTMAKAIRFAWDQPKIEGLTQRLDRMRSLLYSEVMMNIQKSVGIIKQNSDHTGGLLARLFTSQSQYQVESQQTFHNNHLAVEDLLNSQSSQLLQMDEAASQRHNDVVRAISAFTELLKGRTLFPALPNILTQVDPSLKPAALDGFEAIENAVLAALYFRRMDIREAQVQQAYKDTCTWVYEDPEEHQKPWNNFRRWLEEESGCYWIEGKAGCGKSTLMKFLRSDPRTHAAL